jgi:aminoglycoside adenylyltransferase-like protein/nucleotidyltransferase-like protein
VSGPPHTHPTPFPELNALLAGLSRSVAAILGGNFHAAILQGSFAVGDFDRDSDVDFLVVTNGEVADAHLPALQAMHRSVYAQPVPWAQHLEGSYIPRDVLRDPAATASDLWYLDHGSQSLVRSTHCNTIVVRWTVREHGIPLAGPAPRSLVDPIPVEALVREVFTTMCDWGGTSLLVDPRPIDSLWYQSFVVVSYCRMLHTLYTRTIASKAAAVRWALDTLDQRWTRLIERAWAERPDPALKCRLPVDSEDRTETVAFVRYAIDVGREFLKR